MANVNNWGLVGLEDLASQRVAQVGVERVYSAVAESLREYTRTLNELLAGWATPTTSAQMQFELASSGTLQPIDEHGNPLPRVPSGSYQVAFPIQGGGDAWGNDRITRAMLTVEEANRFTVSAQQRDADWMIRHLLAALLDDTSWTINDRFPVAPGVDPLGTITIQPLANGDAVTYGRKGAQVASGDDHYLAQAADISDAANPFPTIRAELLEHPSNMNGPITAYVASDLTADIQGLAGFVEVDDPRVMYGANTDRVGYEEFGNTGPGDAVLGQIARVRVVEWGALPSGYIVAKMDGKAPLRMRQLYTPELQGLFPESYNVDGNHLVERVLRYAGFGVADRVAAVVYQVGNGTYQIPSGFATPLAV